MGYSFTTGWLPLFTYQISLFEQIEPMNIEFSCKIFGSNVTKFIAKPYLPHCDTFCNFWLTPLLCVRVSVVDRHALYELGVTPLVLVWKDAQCSQYLLDTDSQGNVPAYQQVWEYVHLINLLPNPVESFKLHEIFNRLCCVFQLIYFFFYWVSSYFWSAHTIHDLHIKVCIMCGKCSGSSAVLFLH